MNEVTTTETTPAPTPQEVAEQYVKEHNLTDVVTRLATLDQRNSELLRSNASLRDELKNWKNSITEFLKDHIKNDAVDVDDLKELADELDIELNKRIKVRFTIDVEGEFTVPLDFDESDVSDEADFFAIRIEADPSDGDHEVYSEEWNVNDVEAEEVN